MNRDMAQETFTATVLLDWASGIVEAASYGWPDDYEDSNPEWRTCECSACTAYRTMVDGMRALSERGDVLATAVCGTEAP